MQRRSLLSSRNIRHHTGFLCVLRYFEIYQKKSSGNWSESGLECPLEYLHFALFGFVIGSKISRHFLSQSKPTVIFFGAFLALATGPHVLASTRDWFMLVLGPLLIGHSNWQTTQAIRCLKASNRDLMIRQRRRKWKLHWKTQYAFFHSSNNYTKKAFSLPFTTDIKKEQRVSKPSKTILCSYFTDSAYSPLLFTLSLIRKVPSLLLRSSASACGLSIFPANLWKLNSDLVKLKPVNKSVKSWLSASSQHHFMSLSKKPGKWKISFKRTINAASH